MNIDDALRALAEREQWELDDLPDGVGLDELRVLDDQGIIGLQVWARQSTGKHPGDNTWEWQPWPYGWRSPIHDGPNWIGTWSVVWEKGRRRGEYSRPHLLKLNDRGLAAVAKLGPSRRSRTRKLLQGATKTQIMTATTLGDTNFRNLLRAAKIKISCRGAGSATRTYKPAEIEAMANALEKRIGPDGNRREWRHADKNAAALRSLLG